MRDAVEKVSIFMDRQLISRLEMPDNLASDSLGIHKLKIRLMLIVEEFSELLESVGATQADIRLRSVAASILSESFDGKANCDLTADAIADLIYVLLGMALEMGLPIAAIFAEVHRSNMTKDRGQDTAGKITKGLNYKQPRIAQIINGELCGFCGRADVPMADIGECTECALANAIAQPMELLTYDALYSSAHDPVNRPSHYVVGKYECLAVIEELGLGFHLGNAMKYLWRAGRKSHDHTVEDLEKAVFYIKRQISKIRGEI